MGNAYTADYLASHSVYEDQFRDRKKALETAKQLRKDGYTVKVTKICPFGDPIWCVEGEKRKEVRCCGSRRN